MGRRGDSRKKYSHYRLPSRGRRHNDYEEDEEPSSRARSIERIRRDNSGGYSSSRSPSRSSSSQERYKSSPRARRRGRRKQAAHMKRTSSIERTPPRSSRSRRSSYSPTQEAHGGSNFRTTRRHKNRSPSRNSRYHHRVRSRKHRRRENSSSSDEKSSSRHGRSRYYKSPQTSFSGSSDEDSSYEYDDRTKRSRHMPRSREKSPPRVRQYKEKQNRTSDPQRAIVNESLDNFFIFLEAKKRQKKAIQEASTENIPSPKAQSKLPVENATSEENSNQSTNCVQKETQSVNSVKKDETILNHETDAPSVSCTKEKAQNLASPESDLFKIESLQSYQRENISMPTSSWMSGSVSVFFDLQQVGAGSFGEVYRAKHKDILGHVALKRIKMEVESQGFPITALREVKLLRRLHNPFVVCLIGVVSDFEQPMQHLKNSSHSASFYMVFEYMEHDLTGLLEAGQLVNLTEKHLRQFMQHLMQGLEYCHGLHIFHRDLKSSNLLVNNRGQLKIADFGLARKFEPTIERQYTDKVITRFYRPPELLLGASNYGPEVDIWSSGCIFGEMYVKRPIFPGKSDLTQLDAICAICGTPRESSWPGLQDLPGFETMHFQKHVPNRLKEFAQKHKMGEDAVDLLERLLRFNPKARISAKEALQHSYLKLDYPLQPLILTCQQEERRKRRMGRLDSCVHSVKSEHQQPSQPQQNSLQPPITQQQQQQQQQHYPAQPRPPSLPPLPNETSRLYPGQQPQMYSNVPPELNIPPVREGFGYNSTTNMYNQHSYPAPVHQPKCSSHLQSPRQERFAELCIPSSQPTPSNLYYQQHTSASHSYYPDVQSRR